MRGLYIFPLMLALGFLLSYAFVLLGRLGKGQPELHSDENYLQPYKIIGYLSAPLLLIGALGTIKALLS